MATVGWTGTIYEKYFQNTCKRNRENNRRVKRQVNVCSCTQVWLKGKRTEGFQDGSNVK